MCGIIAAFHKKAKGPVNDWVVERYEDQYSRGHEGFGIVRIDGKMKAEVKRACEGAKFMFDLQQKESLMMVAHHRMPTSSPNFLGQTHPLFVSHDSLDHDYLVVHNGVISNEDEIREKHLKLGFLYQTDILVAGAYASSPPHETFNDSEALAIELALVLDGEKQQVETQGSAAFVVLQLNKEKKTLEKVHFGRNRSNPLVLQMSRDLVRLSSEGSGNLIEADLLYSFNPSAATFNLLRTKFVVPTYSYSYKGGHLTPATTKTEEQKKETADPFGAKAVTGFKAEAEQVSIWEGGKKAKNEEEDIWDEWINEQIAFGLENAVEEFSEVLRDPDAVHFADIDETMRKIRTVLVDAKEDAKAQHEYLALGQQTSYAAESGE